MSYAARRPAYRRFRKVAKRYVKRRRYARRYRRYVAAPEKKYHDTLLSATITTSGFTTNTFQLSQGVTNTTRIGNKVTLRSIYIRYMVHAGDIENAVRVILFRWKGLGTPTVDTVLSPGTSDPHAAEYGMVNPEYASNIKILFDRLHLLGVETPSEPTNTSLPYAKAFRYFKKCYTPISFAGTTTTPENYSYWMLCLSDSSAGNHPGIDCQLRYRFNDN